jgi:hypothetical protein
MRANLKIGIIYLYCILETPKYGKERPDNQKPDVGHLKQYAKNRISFKPHPEHDAKNEFL